MKKVLTVFFIVIITAQAFIGCSKSSTGTAGTGGSNGGRTFTCSANAPTFSADIQPILTTVCSINSTCHGGSSTNSGGPFTSYTEVNAKKSNIRAAILAGTMPKTGTITQAQIDAFICWIDGGAANN